MRTFSIVLLTALALAGCGTPPNNAPKECVKPADALVDAATLSRCASAYAANWHSDTQLEAAFAATNTLPAPFDGTASMWTYVFASGGELRSWRIDAATGQSSMEGTSSDLPPLVQQPIGIDSLASGRIHDVLLTNETAAGFLHQFSQGGSDYRVNSTGWIVRLSGEGAFLDATIALPDWTVATVTRQG